MLNPIKHILYIEEHEEGALNFVGNLDGMKEVIADAWDEFSKRVDYVKSW